MTPQEAQIIRDVFAKIRMMGSGPGDAEAMRAVEAELRANPTAALGLVQVVVGLERERDALARQNSDLAARLDELQARMAPQPSGGLFGGAAQPSPWGGRAADPYAGQGSGGPWGAAPAAGPWGTSQQGGGFWSSALRTGAGVAGGLFAFEALRGLFGGGHGYGGPGTASGLFDAGPTVVETVNVFEGDRGGDSSGGFADAPRDGAMGGGGFVADNIDFGGGGGFGGDDSA